MLLEKRKFKIIERLSAFVASNFLGTCVDTLVLWIFSDFVFSSYVGQVIISPLISFECAVLCNFCCSFFLIWKDRIAKKGVRSFFGKFWKYNLSVVGGFLIKMCFLMLFERLLGWDVVWCNLLALCFSGVYNFVMGEKVIFRKKTAKKEADGLEGKDDKTVSKNM
ncbi:MAG: GtrA family protein [Candidatus Cryptobacteroides sp.]